MSVEIARPKLEGNIAVGTRSPNRVRRVRRSAGTADLLAARHPRRRAARSRSRPGCTRRSNGIRLIGVDRPGIGSSTPHAYADGHRLRRGPASIADVLGIDKMEIIGLSGGGPYTLGCAAAMPDRVVAVGVLGGVAPTRGADAHRRRDHGQGRVSRWRRCSSTSAAPLSLVATGLIRLVKPVAEPALYLYAGISPEGDRRLLVRPEFKAMFLDDLLNGSRKQLARTIRRRRGVRPGLGFPARRGQGAGALVARRL